LKKKIDYISLIATVSALFIVMLIIYVRSNYSYWERGLIYATFIFILIILSLYISYKERKLKKKQGLHSKTQQDLIVNSSKFERYIIIWQSGIQNEIASELKYYQQIVSKSNGKFKINETETYTIIWFYDKTQFIHYFEILISLQEKFSNTIGYLKSDDKKRSTFVYDNHYKDDYSILPCITEMSKTGIIKYPFVFSDNKIEIEERDLTVSRIINERINIIKKEITRRSIIFGELSGL